MSSRKKWQAKSVRNWNRREFAVDLNSGFPILKPTGWFSAAPLPGGFRYLGGQPKGPSSQQVYGNPTSIPNQGTPKQGIPGQAGSYEATTPLQIVAPSKHEYRLKGPALIVLAAIAITSLLLWWIMSVAPSNRY
jgi:hypothetical protein